MNWIDLTSIGQFNDILGKSLADGSTALIFKHSTRCSVSATAKSRLEISAGELIQAACYYLDIFDFRDVSDYIEEKLGIRHESPQLIVIKNGRAILHRSHFSISPDEITTVLGN